MKENRKKLILIADDEINIVELLKFNLIKEGYDIIESFDGDTTIELIQEKHPDLILLDIMLPKLDGLSVCKKIRYTLNIPNIPILIISAKDTETDKIVGLEMGADDYITKPFQIREVIARIKANLRNSELINFGNQNYQLKHKDGEIIKVGDLSIDLKKVEVKVKDKVIVLTKKEFDVLKFLAERPGQVTTAETLYNEVWGYSEIVGDNVPIYVTMKRIRDKIEVDSKHPQILKTKRGVGYYINNIE